MVRYALLSILLIVLASGCASSRSMLMGTWVLVESQGDARHPSEPPAAEDLVKVVGEMRFSFAAQAGPGEVFAGGGTWDREGDTYVEHIRYHSHQELVGADAPFTCRVEDGLWHHDGEFTSGGRSYAIHEVWRRVHEEGDR